jgi:hypothetical protein
MVFFEDRPELFASEGILLIFRLFILKTIRIRRPKVKLRTGCGLWVIRLVDRQIIDIIRGLRVGRRLGLEGVCESFFTLLNNFAALLLLIV